MNRFKRQAWYSWAFIAVLATLSIVLASLQYRWIGEVSRAEEDRLRTNLRATLERLRNDFNDVLSQSSMALMPRSQDLQGDRDAVFLQRFKQWRDSSHRERLFSAITRVIPESDGTIALRQLDQMRVSFHTVDWPANWGPLRGEFLRQESTETPGAPPRTDGVDFIVVPLFGQPGRPLEWVVFEVDLHYVSSVLMPESMEKLGGYDAELVSRNDAATVIFQSNPDRGGRIAAAADEQVGLLDVQPPAPDRPARPADPMRGKWLLSVRHQAGSVDSLVARTRLRNIAVTTAILALMLATIAALVRYTRRAQALSQLQMQFVAGVSHELRTPLTVIRTAAHNLSSGIVRTGDVDQIQRYGRLIGGQTEKLTALVEQVLGFANAEAGRAISKREPVFVEPLVKQALGDCESIVAESRCEVEVNIPADIPPLYGDPMALRHALQNLITNAAKYGSDGRWIGVSAAMATAAKGEQMIEVRVSDRGAGIPTEERGQIFEPFVRGRRAIDDQVHGTGLGLALVKRIVEAHGGTIEVRPGPGSIGSEFAFRIPPAPPEEIDEFADFTS